MTGLEDRLRGVNGVADIVVELGDDGLEGIRVRMSDGTDESVVLEEIRRILVAYGLKGSARRARGIGGIPSLDLGDAPEATGSAGPRGADEAAESAAGSADAPEAAREGGEIGAESDTVEGDNDGMHDEVPPGPPRPTIIPDGDRLTVRLSDGDRTVEATADASPMGAADAMIRTLCEWRGRALPHRVAVDRLDLDGADIVIVTGKHRGSVAVGASAVQGSLAEALRDAADQVVGQLDSI